MWHNGLPSEDGEYVIWNRFTDNKDIAEFRDGHFYINHNRCDYGVDLWCKLPELNEILD